MANLIFYLSLLTLLYTFVFYPVFLKLMALFIAKFQKGDIGFYPRVSIVLSVYNEEKVIREKIENFFEIDYPSDKIEFVIISDCCSDGTEDIIRSYEDSRIILIVQSTRAGKTSALNRAVPDTTGEILIFTDANSIFDKNSIRKLIQHFSDPCIGLVSGRSIYLDSENKLEEIGGAYRKYEEMIKEKESAIGSIAGADGAIYALRKNLYTPLKPQYINDFIHPIQVVLRGFRAISEPEAVCRETIDDQHKGEFFRQIRIMAQSWLIFLSQFKALLVGKHYCFLGVIVSHKLLRWLTIPLMCIFFVATFFLFNAGVLYTIAFIAQLSFYSLALVGSRMNKGLIKAPYLFVQLHCAAILGLFFLFSGNQFIVWNPRNK